jgi:hypothetical protein
MGPFDPQTNSTLAKLWSTLVGRRWVLRAGVSPALRTQGVVGFPNLSALSRYVAGARAPAHRASVLRVQGRRGGHEVVESEIWHAPEQATLALVEASRRLTRHAGARGRQRPSAWRRSAWAGLPTAANEKMREAAPSTRQHGETPFHPSTRHGTSSLVSPRPVQLSSSNAGARLNGREA